MGYVERRVAFGGGRLELGLALPSDRASYDIDFFGMDDGLDRRDNAAFRFLFQLGFGYMIHLYVVGVPQPGVAWPWFHTFWTKDCAVAEVEREEHGPPARVRCETLLLPRIYETFVLEREAVKRRFRVGDATFDALVDDETRHLEVCFALTSEDGDPAQLAWSAAAGWRLRERGGFDPIPAGERVTFAEPVAGGRT